MPKFRVTLRGEGYLLGGPRLGFYTNRFVVANSPNDAMHEAIRIIRDDLAGQVRNDSDDSPSIFIEEVVDGWPEYEGVQHGFVFFDDPLPTAHTPSSDNVRP